ncbi:hypothetical protein CYMTET_26239 [Cymbomonas tetramitiformis]|uniref:Uncharacterized protein n=1 Tax=Cymbomonas tetramitiformis TaxID=36881 RepID=A0AAE0FS63_9CHLO|nr:hypothetical protein CYMTET_26239 [Cymbomonas tetramitiformis]
MSPWAAQLEAPLGRAGQVVFPPSVRVSVSNWSAVLTMAMRAAALAADCCEMDPAIDFLVDSTGRHYLTQKVAKCNMKVGNFKKCFTRDCCHIFEEFK